MNWQPPPPNKPGGPGPGGPGPGGHGPGPGPGGPGPGGPAGQRPPTLYELLQVDTTAHPTIIRYAYRYLAGIYHPDNAETGNAEIFRQITDAFKTLSDQGRRAAYDAKMGPALHGGMAAAMGTGPDGKPKSGFTGMPHMEKTSLSYSEVELRLAVLQLMLQARKKKVQTGGCSAKVLMDVLGADMAEMEFALWYLRESGLVERQEAQFMITVKGVDYLINQLSKTHIIDEGPKSVPTPPGGGGNLPAPLR